MYTHIHNKNVKTWLGRIYIGSRRVVHPWRKREENEMMRFQHICEGFLLIGSELTMTNVTFVIFG